MALLTLAQAKKQVRLEEDETFDDDYLDSLCLAASAYLSRRLECTFIDTQDELDALEEPPANPVVVEKAQDLTLAAAQLVGHWYKNRESVSDVAQAEVPMSFEMLIFEFRHHAIG